MPVRSRSNKPYTPPGCKCIIKTGVPKCKRCQDQWEWMAKTWDKVENSIDPQALTISILVGVVRMIEDSGEPLTRATIDKMVDEFEKRNTTKNAG